MGGNAGAGGVDSSIAKDRLSDAWGPRFEPQTGWGMGKSNPSLWKDKHPVIKGPEPSTLNPKPCRAARRPPRPDPKKTPPSQTNN